MRDGKTHRAYLWAYAPGAFEEIKAVVYDFCESRAGEHARAFLGDWKGSLNRIAELLPHRWQPTANT